MTEEEVTYKIEDFIKRNYRAKLEEAIRTDKPSLEIDFNLLERYDPYLSDLILDNPGFFFNLISKVIEEIDLSFEQKKVDIKFKNLPESQYLKVSDIRGKHLNQLIFTDGLIRQTSDIRPICYSIVFECLACGEKQELAQDGFLIKRPERCACGKRGKFKVIDEKLIDTQRISIEELPETLEGGEQPKRINAFLKGKLVDPSFQKNICPGTKIKLIGIPKKIPILSRTGSRTTRFDLVIEVNNIIPIEKEFEEIELKKEDIQEIKKLAKDPNIFTKLKNSIAPAIYGYDLVKEALAHQLFGGVKKIRPDGTSVRGDMHILLIGDPGTAKCVSPTTKVYLADGKIETVERIVESQLKKKKIETIEGIYSTGNHDLFSLSPNGKIIPSKSTVFWKLRAPKYMYKIKTKTGREVEVTSEHPFFVCTDGYIIGKKTKDIKLGDYIATPRIIPALTKIPLINFKMKSGLTNAVHIKIPKKLNLNICEIFGYLLGEGTISKDTIFFVNSDNNILIRFKNLVETTFKVKARINYPKNRVTRVLVCSVELVNFLRKLSKNISKTAGFKRVPPLIMRSPNKLVSGFLRAYFDADSTISKKENEIKLTSKSKNIIYDVQTLLLRFGIISQVCSRFAKASNSKMNKKKYWMLTISNKENLEKFYKNINFYKKDKKKILIQNLKGKKGHHNIDIIPNLFSILKEIRFSLKMKQRDFNLPRTTFMHYERGERNPTRNGLKKLVRHLKTLNFSPNIKEKIFLLEALCNSDIFWDKVISIKQYKPKKKWVYDLEVNNFFNFIADNIFVHNTQILLSMGKIAPKSRYVTGRGTTTAGLCASVVKDEFLKGWALEAGALVLANKGFALVDEIDKMSKEDSVAMHEALESQTVTISKANIHASLRAETSVLAAANPKFSRFNPQVIPAEQIDIAPTLLSRFDLIFPMRDVPNSEEDKRIADKILQSHTAPESLKPEIPTKLLRKYIAYAKMNCFPKITKEAEEEIQKFYVDLRNKRASGESLGPVSISPRQLEAVIRLSEASARIKLQDKVKKEDAKRAIKLVKFYLQEVGMEPETGEIDIDRIVSNVSTVQRNRIFIIKEIIKHLEKEKGENIPINDIIEKAVEKGIEEDKIREVIDKMKKEGEIFEPKQNIIKRVG